MTTTPSPRSHDRPGALALGAGVTLLGVIRALGRRGVGVRSRVDDERVVSDSRWFEPAPRPAPPAKDLSDYLARAGVGPVVLLPCSDDSSREVAEVMESGPADVFASVSAPGVQDRLVDKGLFADLLTSTGTPHPRTVVVDRDSSLGDLDPELLAHAFLKPRDSQAFFRRFQVKALRPGPVGDLSRILRSVIDEGFEVVIQEYVPGPASNHYFIDGFIDREGRIRARLARQRLRMHPPDFGNSSYMRSVPLGDAAPAVEALDALLTGIGFRGPYSAEFKRDERDGVFRILEVNARPWWYVEFAARCGVDVTWMAYLDALGEPVPEQSSYEVGRTLVYPHYDISACAREIREGRLTTWGWLSSWLGSDRPLFAWDDPRPAIWETWRTLIPAIRRRLPGRVAAARAS